MEQVLVITKDDFEVYFENPYGSFAEGLDKSFFIPRDIAEDSPEYKQIIPYIVIRNRDNYNILTYKRTKSGGEGRLHEKYSIGIGGHINPEDHQIGNSGIQTVLNAAQRELKEEINFSLAPRVRLQLLPKHIYDDSNEVGKVHCGLPFLLDLPSELAKVISSSEDAIDDIYWSDTLSLYKNYKLENWSKIVLKTLMETNI